MTDETKTATEPPLDCIVMPLALGTETEWGTIGAVGITGGERYYWMVDKHEGVSMIPAFVVEGHNDPA